VSGGWYGFLFASVAKASATAEAGSRDQDISGQPHHDYLPSGTAVASLTAIRRID
jgi:hypothetical protein